MSFLHLRHTPSQIIFAGGNANNGSSVVPMENRISRSPVIRPVVDVQPAPSPTILDTLRVLDMPESQTVIIHPDTPQNQPQSTPLDVTMLAVLGMTMAGAGVMKSQTAMVKKKEQQAQQAQALDNLKTLQSAQKAEATANWVQNQTMQTHAHQQVITQVMQSQANIEFMDGYNRWYRESTIKNLLIQIQQAVTLDGIKNTVNQALGRYGTTQDGKLSRLFDYWNNNYGQVANLDASYIQNISNAEIAEIMRIQQEGLTTNYSSFFEFRMQDAFGYNIQWGNTLLNDAVGQWKSLANLLASNLHIASYFNENMNNYMPSNNIEQGLEVIRNYFAKIPTETGISPTTIYLGKDDKTGGKDLGYVPLPASTSDAIELKTIYLGSDVNVATITHELGHQLDRWFKISHIQDNIASIDRDFTSGITGYLSTNTAPITNTVAFDIYTYIGILNSFAGKQLYPEEFWADIFMTAVLDGQDFGVFSLDFENINYRSYGSQLARFTDFITCEKDENDNWSAILTLLDGTELKITCTEDKLVAWQDNNNARSILATVH